MAKNRVIFYIHNGVHLLDLSGAVQAFYEAEEFGHPYEMLYVGGQEASRASAGLPFMRLEHFPTVEPGAGDILIVAGFELRELHSGEPGVHAWLRAAADRGAVVASVCTAAFLLAAAGLLDGKECTTHWKYYQARALHSLRHAVGKTDLFRTTGTIKEPWQKNDDRLLSAGWGRGA